MTDIKSTEVKSRAKPLSKVMPKFEDRLRKLQAEIEQQEQEEQEAFDALPEERKQRIRDALRKQQLENQKLEERERQRDLIEFYKAKGISPKFYAATWENWISDTDDKLKAKNIVKGSAWKTNLFLCGKSGTGKTHLAMCLAKDGAKYRRLPDIFREVRMNLSEEQNTIDYYGSVKLLVIDEIGRQKFTPFEYNLFFEIIDKRWNNELPTTLITNLSEKEFVKEYSTAVIDRLRPITVEFAWESHRESLNLDAEPAVPQEEEIDF